MSIYIEPTISMQRGTTTVVQCMQCGCIATIPTERWQKRRSAPVGPCPVCDEHRWKKQRMPVGGLRARDEVQS